MNIFTKDFTPPQTLFTSSFCLFPTSIDFYESDYVAVMENKELLRIWSQSSWPEDDFTSEMNKEDLKHHIEDNHHHTAYGYMIYSLDKKTCYGSLYVNPIRNTPENYHLTKEEINIINSIDARIDCWIAQLSSDLELFIIKELKNWFESVWKIDIFFSARKGMDKRIKIYEEIGLTKKLDVKSKNSEMSLLLF